MGLPDSVALGVDDGLFVCVAVELGLAVGVRLLVEVDDCVVEHDSVSDGVTVAVEVELRVGVRVLLAVDVIVGESEFVDDDVTDCVPSGDGVGVSLGVVDGVSDKSVRSDRQSHTGSAALMGPHALCFSGSKREMTVHKMTVQSSTCTTAATLP